MHQQHQHRVVDLTMDDIDAAAREIVDVIGREWIGAERKRVKAERRSAVEVDPNAYLFHRPAHLLIEWTLQYDRWRGDCIAAGDFALYEDVLRIVDLGTALRKTKTMPNFTRVLGRLKDPREFESAAFEIETAAAYVSRGWNVTFVEEGKERSPDLEVRTDKGNSFWVECKRRDKATPRDKHVDDFWLNFDRNITKAMVQEKLNYLVEIHAVADPKQANLGPLGRRVIRAMRESRNVGAYDFGSGASSPDISQIPGYEIVVVRLADADLARLSLFEGTDELSG